MDVGWRKRMRIVTQEQKAKQNKTKPTKPKPTKVNWGEELARVQ